MSRAGRVNDTNIDHVGYRSVGDWSFSSATTYASPFADVTVNAVFTAPSGRVLRMPAFHHGDGTWKVRFNPGEVGP